MDVLQLLLGALLAIGGGLIAQRQEQILRGQREEQGILVEVNEALLDLHAILAQAGYGGMSVERTSATEALEEERKTADIRGRLSKLAVGLKCSDHREIAVRLTKLSLDAPFRTKDNVLTVTRQVQLRLNPKMIKRYEREISNTPEHF
jgi:hypothetical protein